MYVGGWLILVIVSLAVSLIAFIWALESGQFRDQERLRYLPLADLPEAGEEAVSAPGSGRWVARGLLLVIVVGIAVWLAPLVVLFWR